jgi:hypothetical protein
MYRRAGGLCYFARDAFLPIGRSLLSLLLRPGPKKGTKLLIRRNRSELGPRSSAHTHTYKENSFSCMR